MFWIDQAAAAWTSLPGVERDLRNLRIHMIIQFLSSDRTIFNATEICAPSWLDQNHGQRQSSTSRSAFPIAKFKNCRTVGACMTATVMSHVSAWVSSAHKEDEKTGKLLCERHDQSSQSCCKV
jgi:hypothetical protein